MLKLTNLDFDFDLFLKEYNRVKSNERDYARGGKSVDFWRFKFQASSLITIGDFF